MQQESNIGSIQQTKHIYLLFYILKRNTLVYKHLKTQHFLNKKTLFWPLCHARTYIFLNKKKIINKKHPKKYIN